MKTKPTIHLAFPLAAAIAALLATPYAHAAVIYWDPASSGSFGSVDGTITWAAPLNLIWTTSNTGGTTRLPTYTTTLSDDCNFGGPTASLGVSSTTGNIPVNTVDAGTLSFNTLGNNLTLLGGTITLKAASSITTVNASQSHTITSVLAGAATSLTKTGAGTLILSGASTYAGTTIINVGTLNLGGGTANGSLASTTLTLGGGAFSYTRTGSTTQGFTTTNINGGGATQISVVSGNILNLGTVARGVGGALDFSTTGLGTVAALTASNTNGIMAGLTFGNTWAVANGAGVAISGLGSYTLTSVAGTTGSNYTDSNMEVDSSEGLIDAAITTNSLRFSEAEANTMTLATGPNIITTGGILVNSTVGSNLSTITGGTLTGVANKDLAIIQNNTGGGLTISSSIVNTTLTSVTKSGAGLLTLDANNTFTGGLTINGGQVRLNNAGALNSTTPNNVTFGSGAIGTLTLNGNSLTIPVLNTNAAPGTTIIENANAGNVMLTINSASNSTFAGVIQNGTGGGTLALTKAGAGTLTLSGANTYTGGTTLSVGTVAISNATSFGAGSVSVTGSSKITAAGGITYANAIDVGSALTLQIPSATPGTATFSGQLTGASAITVEATLVNGVTGTHAFTHTNNTFTGSVFMPIGTTGTGSGNDFFSFNSIGDGGTFSFRKRGHTNAITYTGSSAITFGTRQIALSATDFGGLFDGGGVNPVNSFRNNAADPVHTVTFSTDLTPTTINSAGTFFFAGSNTGNNIFSGIISNPSNFNLGIGKADAGKWILTGANSYLGNVKVSGGTLSVNAIAPSTTNQPLGKGTIVELGHQNTAGTLEFTGASNSSTDKQVQMGNLNSSSGNAGGAIILNNGSRSLTFTNGTFNPTVATVTATRTLTLGGSYDSSLNSNLANEIQGIIQDNVASTGKVALTVSGSTWKLSGTNSYTGATTVSGGTLLVNSPGSLAASSAVAVNAGTLGGNGTISGNVTVAAAGSLAPGASPGTLNVGGNLNISAPANGGAGKLNFELDALANTNDKIAVTGTLTIGIDKLGFSDFIFTNLGGLQVTGGTPYKLITSSGITALNTLDPADLTGTLPGGLNGTLQLNGGDVELVVTSTGSTYASWIAGFPGVGSFNGVNDDPDFDGIKNGMEMVLGGDPATGMDTALLPTIEMVNADPDGDTTFSDYLLFTYRRSDLSVAAGVTADCETDTDLVGTWTAATGAPGVVIQVDDNFTFSPPAAANTDRVRVYVPRGANPKLFGRLNVVVP